ncbi:MAG TPA: hypothetical protein ENF19_01890 [Candidatus Bathyarchaeota archaeon]|nr:hypothetical protein [Candidatus Bathyarchaeota archaeon]
MTFPWDFGATVKDYCYAYLGDVGRALSKGFKGVERDLSSARIKVHPEVYFSVVAALALASALVPVAILVVAVSGAIPLGVLPGGGVPPLVVATFLLPLLVLGGGILFPKIKASNRISNLKIEIPYASMYISVMVSGGLSPFESFRRMGKMSLLPNMQEEVDRIETIVMSTGMDPLSAMEQTAKTVEIKEFKELLLGYASSVRTGGDTLHYLFNQTHNMFKGLASTVRAKGETAAMLMEAYTIVGILGVLGLFLVFVVGLSIPTAGVSIGSSTFFLFSFVVLPALSFVFIYLGDIIQFNYPLSNWSAYYATIPSIAVGLALATQLVLPFFQNKPLPRLAVALSNARAMAGMPEGTEACLGITICLLAVALPSWVADYYFAGRDGNVSEGVTLFLRDMVEVRKSGLSPERCIEALAHRDYMGFTRHLRDISTKMNWGYPLRQIYEELSHKVRNWLALVNLYLLLDTIEVGGGTEESIETLAEFSEATKLLEKEKRAALMPLILVPYIGCLLLTGTTLMFLGFFTSSNLGISVAEVSLYRTLLTPLAVHSFTLGLVTGKIVTGRVSAGFKHSALLSLVSTAGVFLVSRFNTGGLI